MSSFLFRNKTFLTAVKNYAQAVIEVLGCCPILFELFTLFHTFCPYCVKSVQIWNYFWSVFSHIRTEYGSEKSPYLDTFYAVPGLQISYQRHFYVTAFEKDYIILSLEIFLWSPNAVRQVLVLMRVPKLFFKILRISSLHW